jgi:hypothetical protein
MSWILLVVVVVVTVGYYTFALRVGAGKMKEEDR